MVRLALAFFIPVALFISVDLLLGRQPYSFPNDNIPGFFGLGLNVATLTPGLRFHHPGYTIVEMAGALSAAFKNARDLNGFFIAGIFVHLALAAALSLWTARIALHLRLGTASLLALSLMVLSMPTVALYAPLLCTYTPAALMFVPLGLGAFAILNEDDPPKWLVRSTLFGMGVMASNLFTSLVVPVALATFIAFLLFVHDLDRIERRLGPPLLPRGRTDITLALLIVNLVRDLFDAARIMWQFHLSADKRLLMRRSRPPSSCWSATCRGLPSL